MFTGDILLILVPAVLGASILQAATGIGYGVIAGPVFLVMLNGGQAFQISAIHNLLIALLLAPFVCRKIDRSLLGILIVGSCIGIPAGFFLQLVVGVVFLKLFSAGVIGLVAANLGLTMWMARVREQTVGTRTPERLVIGVLSGFMGGMLAMPGPVASAWMSLRGWGKDAIRATILVFFVFAYGTTLVLHVIFSVISQATWTLSIVLGPVVVLGIVIGNAISHLVSEAVFRIVLLGVLVSTIVSLLTSI